MLDNKPLILEFWNFMKQNKAWWFAPILIIFALVGVLVVIGQSTSVAPFIYAFF